MTPRGDSLTTSGWRIAAASRRGSSHRDTANQDAVRTELLRDGDGRPVWVAAVSDGHGGPRYVRSDVGAKLAVDVAVAQLSGPVARAIEGAELLDLLRAEVPGMVDGWRRAVAHHTSEHPFTEEEAERSGEAVLEAYPVVAYGATLIVALIADGAVAVAQIGDGDVLVRTNGFAVRPVPGDSRLVAGETTSLCLDTAVDDFRFFSLPPSADADLALIATDGYGNSFADAHWWHDLVGDLASFVDNHGFDELARHFPDWLAESAVVGGDDVTAVVLARDPLTVAPGEPRVLTRSDRPPAPVAAPPRVMTVPAPPVPSPSTGAVVPLAAVAMPASPAGRFSPTLAALAACLVLLAAVLVVWLLFRGDGSRPGGPEITDSPPSLTESPPDDTPGPGGRPGDGPGLPPAGNPDVPDRVGGDQGGVGGDTDDGNGDGGAPDGGSIDREEAP